MRIQYNRVRAQRGSGVSGCSTSQSRPLRRAASEQMPTARELEGINPGRKASVPSVPERDGKYNDKYGLTPPSICTSFKRLSVQEPQTVYRRTCGMEKVSLLGPLSRTYETSNCCVNHHRFARAHIPLSSIAIQTVHYFHETRKLCKLSAS